jgi:Methyltransferase domain
VVSEREQRVHRLLDNPPPLHMNERGELVNLQIDPKLVPHLRDEVFPGARTMETGSGVSTIALLALGAQHTSISPDGGEADRIRAYCQQQEIPTGQYTSIVARSEDVLPTFAAADDLDLAIVDGNHAFPAPFIDWFYLTRLLKPSGVVVVDDVELWTGATLADFLDDEEGIWVRLERNPRFAIYRLVGDKSEALTRGWVDQPHVYNHSDLSVTGVVRPGIVPRLRSQALTVRVRRAASRSWWKMRN